MIKKKIIFDANPIANDKKTGVGTYTYRLIAAMSADLPSDYEMVGYYYNFLGKKKPKLPNAHNIRYRQIRLYPGAMVNTLRRLGIEFPIELLTKERGSIALYPNYLTQPSIFKTKKYVVLHDLSYLSHPDYASDKNRKDLERFVPKSLVRCEGVITVSNFSKDTIVDTFDYPKSMILVTPIPPEEARKVDKDISDTVMADLNIDKPYILFLGTLEPRKNLVGLLRAYEQCAELHKNYNLVLAGGMDWKFEGIAQKITDLQAKKMGVIHCGYVSDIQKAVLYKNASVFVLPSHYEGFGMPILEAMQYDIPVAVSNIPVFHEVADDGAIYFNNNSPDDIARKILVVLQDKQVKNRLVKLGNKNLKRYSWPSVAKSVLLFIQK